jgi:hypothetical protein
MAVRVVHCVNQICTGDTYSLPDALTITPQHLILLRAGLTR